MKTISTADAILDLTGPVVLLNIPNKKKSPISMGWPQLTLSHMTEEYLSTLRENIGVLLGAVSGGLYSIDCDDDERFQEMLGLNPFLHDTLQSHAKRGGNFWIRVVGYVPKSGNFKTQEGEAIGEWRGDGRQTVIYGTHPEGMQYRTNGIPVATVEFAKIQWPEHWQLPWNLVGGGKSCEFASNHTNHSPDQVREMLSHIKTRPDYETWLKITASVRNALGDDDLAIQLLKDWSPEEREGEYENLLSSDFSKITAGTLIFHARQGGYAGSVKPNMVSVASPLPLIQLPGLGRVISEFAEELGQLLNPHGLFNRKGSVFYLQSEEQKLVLMSPSAMRTWLEQYALPYKVRISQGVSFNMKETIAKDLADTVLASPQFISQLPEVERFHPCPMPWTRDDGKIELLPLGLDLKSQTYTGDPGFEIERLPSDEAVNILNTLLEEFAWNPEDKGRSKAVHIAAMLTVFGGGLMPYGSTKPVFIYLANAEGSGKTTLAQLAGLPYQTTPVETAPTNEEEWQKKFMSVVISGRRLLLLDNVKGHLDSPSLEAYTTASHYSGRILGVSKEFTGEAGASVLITGNGLTTTGDLRRRALFVELFLTQLRAEERKFKRTLDSVAMSSVRRDVLCALWTLVCVIGTIMGVLQDQFITQAFLDGAKPSQVSLSLRVSDAPPS